MSQQFPISGCSHCRATARCRYLEVLWVHNAASREANVQKEVLNMPSGRVVSEGNMHSRQLLQMFHPEALNICDAQKRPLVLIRRQTPNRG